jgi:undecaprenyl-diphosphatase
VLEHLVDRVSQLGPWAYLVIFVAVSLESAAFLGFLIPAEMLVLLGGFLASQGVLRLADLLVLVPVAAILGDSVGYELGRCLGRAWLVRVGRRLGFGPPELARLDRFFARHGGKTVFFARFTAFFRIMVPFAAGAARLRYLHFLFYNVLGGIGWAVACVLAGYVAGASWVVVHHWIGRAGAVAAVIVLVAIAWVLRRRWLAAP